MLKKKGGQPACLRRSHSISVRRESMQLTGLYPEETVVGVDCTLEQSRPQSTGTRTPTPRLNISFGNISFLFCSELLVTTVTVCGQQKNSNFSRLNIVDVNNFVRCLRSQLICGTFLHVGLGSETARSAHKTAHSFQCNTLELHNVPSFCVYLSILFAGPKFETAICLPNLSLQPCIRLRYICKSFQTFLDPQCRKSCHRLSDLAKNQLQLPVREKSTLSHGWEC